MSRGEAAQRSTHEIRAEVAEALLCKKMRDAHAAGKVVLLERGEWGEWGEWGEVWQTRVTRDPRGT